MVTPTLIKENTNAETKPTEGQLVRQLRGERSLREFQTYLNENIPAGMPGTTTYQSISDWENGVHPVTGECVMAWLAFYAKDDPRRQLALDIVALRKGEFTAHWLRGKKKGTQS